MQEGGGGGDGGNKDKAPEQIVNDPIKLKIIVELNVLFQFSKELSKKLRFPFKLHQSFSQTLISSLYLICLKFY